MTNKVLGPDIEVAEGVRLDYGKVVRKTCARLDLAYRMVSAFGRPALRMLLEGVRVHDWEVFHQHSDINVFASDLETRHFTEYLTGQFKELTGV